MQLLGVLREIVAEARTDSSGALHSAPSVLFEAPVVAGDTLDWRQLPGLRRTPRTPRTPGCPGCR